MAGEMGGGWDTFCADNLSDVSGFTTSYSFEIVSLVIRPGTMRSEDKDENGTISTKHNSSLVIPSVIVMTMRRFLTCAYGRGHGELHGGRHGGGGGGGHPLIMEVVKVADIEADMVADIEVDKVADMVLVNCAQIFSI